MITANELRIGNWVRDHSKGFLQVESIHQNTVGFKCESAICHSAKVFISPIPLTPEILEKCGFRHEVHDDVSYYIQNKFWFCHSGGDWYLAGDENRTKPFQFLHQLQNLYFALTGIELEYKP